MLIETVTSGGEHLIASSYLDYRDDRDGLKGVGEVAIARLTPVGVGADEPWALPVAVISHRMWQGRFHGDLGVLGTVVRLARRAARVDPVRAVRWQ